MEKGGTKLQYTSKKFSFLFLPLLTEMNLWEGFLPSFLHPRKKKTFFYLTKRKLSQDWIFKWISDGKEHGKPQNTLKKLMLPQTKKGGNRR